MTNATYETISGTPPDAVEAHEPRTIRQLRNNSLTQMMSEIDDCLFAAWAECRKCKKHVANCTCTGGPTEPEYITRWRQERFASGITNRLPQGQVDDLNPAVHTKVDNVALDRALDTALVAVHASETEREI